MDHSGILPFCRQRTCPRLTVGSPPPRTATPRPRPHGLRHPGSLHLPEAGGWGLGAGGRLHFRLSLQPPNASIFLQSRASCSRTLSPASARSPVASCRSASPLCLRPFPTNSADLVWSRPVGTRRRDGAPTPAGGRPAPRAASDTHRPRARPTAPPLPPEAPAVYFQFPKTRNQPPFLGLDARVPFPLDTHGKTTRGLGTHGGQGGVGRARDAERKVRREELGARSQEPGAGSTRALAKVGSSGAERHQKTWPNHGQPSARGGLGCPLTSELYWTAI